MNMPLIQIIASIAMVGVAVAMYFAFRRYLAVNSERRMRQMLESVGVDPALVTSGEIPTIMKEVRQRCRTCNSESVCERWLAGDKEDDNAFCPNAEVFEVLKKYSGATG